MTARQRWAKRMVDGEIRKREECKATWISGLNTYDAKGSLRFVPQFDIILQDGDSLRWLTVNDVVVGLSKNGTAIAGEIERCD